MVSEAERERERAKYVHVYEAMGQRYAMGGARKADAQADVLWAIELGCESHLDIGCGRGEMIDFSIAQGMQAHGVEQVPALCGRPEVVNLRIDQLDTLAFKYDLVTSFDVIEHVNPGDDVLLLDRMASLAKKCLAVTANNRPSVDPTSGNDLHINKRPYPEWDDIIRSVWEPLGWTVTWCKGKQYVSETWRAHR